MIKLDFSKLGSKIKASLVTRTSILVACIVISFLFTFPFFLDNSSLKFYLEEKVSKKLNGHFQVDGEIYVAFLPSPRIIVNDISFNNLLSDSKNLDINAKSVTIKPEIFSLFNGNLKINSLIFKFPKIKLGASNIKKNEDKKEDKIEDHFATDENPTEKVKISLGLTGKIFNFQKSDSAIFDLKNVKKIIIEDGYFTKIDSDNKISLEFTNIDLQSKNNSKKKSFLIEGSFFSEKMPTKLEVDIDGTKSNNSKIKISSPILRMNLDGKFSNIDFDDLIKSDFSGKLDADIVDLKSVLNKYFSKNNLIYRKINSAKPIRITANIEGKAGEVNIDNIDIKSELISGTADIESDFALARPTIDINISLNNIDIDSMWLSAATANNKEVVNIEGNIIKNFFENKPQSVDDSVQDSSVQDKAITESKEINPEENKETKPENILAENILEKKDIRLFGNVDLTAEIKINNARYLGGDLSDISLYLIATKEGDVLIQPLLVNVPGSGVFRIIGALQNENDIPKFVGKMDASGKDLGKFLFWIKLNSENLNANSLGAYNFTADILALSNFVVLSNLYANLNNGKNLLIGNIKIDDSAGFSSIYSDFQVSELKIDDYFIIPEKISYFNPGSLLKKIFWLNNIKSDNEISLSFNSLIYKDKIFNNQNFKIGFGQGYFKVSDLDLKSDDLSAKGNFSISIANNAPMLNADFDIDNLKYKTALDRPQSGISEEKLQDKNDDINKEVLNQIPNPKWDFGKQFFDLPSIEDFKGAINLKIKHLEIDDFEIKNAKINSKIDGGSISIDDAVAEIYGGVFKYNGAVLIKFDKTINGSFEIKGANLDKFLDDILNINNVSGIASMAGTITSTAGNKKEFFDNLTTKIKFIGGNVTVNRFGIDDLVRKMLDPLRNLKELNKPEEILINPEYKSFFKEVNGALEIVRDNRSNKLRIETSSKGINSVTTGSINFADSSYSGVSNFVFITGSKQKQTPLTIAIGVKGKFGELKTNANVDQVNQYLRN